MQRDILPFLAFQSIYFLSDYHFRFPFLYWYVILLAFISIQSCWSAKTAVTAEDIGRALFSASPAPKETHYYYDIHTMLSFEDTPLDNKAERAYWISPASFPFLLFTTTIISHPCYADKPRWESAAQPGYFTHYSPVWWWSWISGDFSQRFPHNFIMFVCKPRPNYFPDFCWHQMIDICTLPAM